MGQLFTIGYSGTPIDRFVSLLVSHKIEVLCDVRSVPYSRVRPEFSRRELKQSVNQAGIKYHFFGDALGARPKERSVYVGGQAVHNLIAQTSFFQAGLDRLKKGASDHNLVLLCSEKDPIECHRAILVCRHLPEIKSAISHIHINGRVETQEQFEDRLVKIHNRQSVPLLGERRPWESLLQEAYDKQSCAIAFSEASVDRRSAAPELVP